MIRIGDVWDSTTAALAGRAGLLTPIALLAFLLPAVAQAALTAYATGSTGVAAAGAVLSIIALVATLWGQLATVAVASDPRTTRAQASAAAAARLPSALLVTLVLVAAAIVAVLPIAIALWSTGFDFRAASGQVGGVGGPLLPFGAALFTFFYGLILFGVGLWLTARLALLNPVILNERRGVGAIGRSMALTCGLTWRLIGVIVLFLIALLVATLAARSVVFIIVRLLLGYDQIATATFMGAIAAAAVTAAFTTVASVFAARLFAAVTAAREPVALAK